MDKGKDTRLKNIIIEGSIKIYILSLNNHLYSILKLCKESEKGMRKGKPGVRDKNLST